ncbi:hypothetical protein ACTJJM_12190 [Stenotrophomonas sp. 22692]|jgi:hypothetical protein|uniref:Lipoprotein n=1 Tax=Stenotrophomonas geniculata TaxID=86188 RepID=A0AAP5C4R8_9GAMM|nr:MULTISPECIES: hypothetical protein [Stenotrophomonas]ALA87301.1 hypothetical protein YH67_13885 [Stenotrophomonas maltophilia]ALA91257.1 hypothetical protein YH68_13885 [Stenotrophomonas maltophilia]KOQ59328.1 hypothetical protein ABW42_17315 [Stenotrophomonas maltophilia]MBH1449265.1 hypothetical protein [Stenotrophomonas maltophilia]MCF3476320.1 hypothetical protein [Stenotrophomonas maltophilia]
MQTLKIATACALLLTTLGLACSGQAAPLSYAQEKENTAKLVDIIDGATRDGLVAVLVPAPYVVHNGGPGVGSPVPGFHLGNRSTDLPGFSTRVSFQHKDIPSQGYVQLFNTNELETGPQRTVLMDVFEVHLIPPGTYLLNGAENYRLNTRVAKLKPLGTTDEVSKDIGATRLADVDYRFYSWKKVWVPPGVLTDQHSQQVCISVHVASGNCVAWGTQNYETSRPTEGYWDDRIVPEDIPAVRIQAVIAKAHAPLAFTAREGQILLSPFIVAADGDIDFNANDCAPVDKLTGCALRRFTVHYQPAPLDAARKHIAITSRGLNGKQRKVLERMEAMQLQVLGPSAPSDAALGKGVSATP